MQYATTMASDSAQAVCGSGDKPAVCISRSKTHLSIITLLACSVLIADGGIFAEDAIEPTPHRLKQQLALASEAAAIGDPGADAIYKQATVDHPDSAEAWAAFGEHLRFYAHDQKAAAEAFEKALVSKQKDANASALAWRGLGELASKEKKDDLAIECFKKSLLALPLADTHRSLCHMYCRRREFNAAAEQAHAAVKLNASDPIALLMYSAQLHRAGQPSEGRLQYDRALAAAGMGTNERAGAPVHCCVVYNAAGYLAVCGDEEEALRMLKKFFQTPNHRHLSRAEIESDADFEGLKLRPEFSKLLDLHLPASIPPK
jgi:tetratricopeptide (TPR) repeat protein